MVEASNPSGSHSSKGLGWQAAPCPWEATEPLRLWDCEGGGKKGGKHRLQARSVRVSLWVPQIRQQDSPSYRQSAPQPASPQHWRGIILPLRHR